MEDAVWWVALRSVPGLHAKLARELLDRLETPQRLFAEAGRERAGELAPEIRAALARRPKLEAAAAELARARALGLEVLTPATTRYPADLRRLEDPPLVLYLRGRLPDAPRISIVGSRRATERGRGTARAFARTLAAAGVCVVSGLAYGIDSAAHRGALDAGGPTLAVLASGLESATPAGNRALAARILEQGGGWLSEHPPGAAALPHHFPERNRVISGLSKATLVVEARVRSGSLWTASHAIGQERSLLVVPGPIDTDACEGSNRLLRDGVAEAVLDDDDLLRAAFDEPPGAPSRPRAMPLAPDEARLLAVLARGPCDADSLARALQLGAAALASQLLELELRGLIARTGSRIALGPAAGRSTS